MKKQVVSKAKIRTIAKESTDGLIGVEDAAWFLGVSNRRVRAFINPECNCVIKKRRQGKKPAADKECIHCNGTGHTEQRLRAERFKGGWGEYRIHPDDLFEFASKKRLTGRPPDLTSQS